jgi:hypothetical protein
VGIDFSGAIVAHLLLLLVLLVVWRVRAARSRRQAEALQS